MSKDFIATLRYNSFTIVPSIVVVIIFFLDELSVEVLEVRMTNEAKKKRFEHRNKYKTIVTFLKRIFTCILSVGPVLLLLCNLNV